MACRLAPALAVLAAAAVGAHAHVASRSPRGVLTRAARSRVRAVATTDAPGATGIGDTLAARVPQLLEYAGSTVVVKYGGHAMTDEALSCSFYADVVLLRRLGVNVVIVHGGGPQITRMLSDLQIKSDFVDGRRVTDERTMEVVEMVLGGLVNNKLVGEISRAGGKAVGLTGQSCGVIGATRMEHWLVADDGSRQKADLGLVGEPTHVDPSFLHDLISIGAIPVVAPIGVGVADGARYNINADTAAGAIASALGATKLLLLTDVAGVLDQSGALLEQLGTADVERLVGDGTITGGMIPKLQTASEAVRDGVGASVILDGRVPHALLLALLPGAGVGTEIGGAQG